MFEPQPEPAKFVSQPRTVQKSANIAALSKNIKPEALKGGDQFTNPDHPLYKKGQDLATVAQRNDSCVNLAAKPSTANIQRNAPTKQDTNLFEDNSDSEHYSDDDEF